MLVVPHPARETIPPETIRRIHVKATLAYLVAVRSFALNQEPRCMRRTETLHLQTDICCQIDQMK
jgi:hypothetical protein